MIHLDACVVGYPGRPVAGPLDLEIRRGDLLLVAGPNGAGKSTLLKTLLGALPPLSGTLRLSPGVRLGYVPQQAALDASYPLTLMEMAAMGLHAPACRGTQAADRSRLRGILEQLELESLADRPYRELSGGQKQRALLARALAAEPDLVLLDEPAEGLDLGAERALEALLLRMRSEGRVAVVQVTHLRRSVSAAAKALFLSEGRGEAGPAPEMLTPSRLSKAYGYPVRVDLLEGRLRVMEDVR